MQNRTSGSLPGAGHTSEIPKKQLIARVYCNPEIICYIYNGLQLFLRQA